MASSNLRAALFMALAMAGYVFNDVFMKALAEDMSMGQAIVLRGMVATLLIWFIAHRSGAMRPVGVALRPMPLLRTVGEVVATVLFLTALPRIYLANATAILQALPLAVTLGASIFLREPVGWRRWVAIIVGFLGVLVIIQPGYVGYSPYSILVAGAVLCAAARDVATRAMGDDVPSLFISVVTSAAVTVTGLGMWIVDGSIAPVTAAHLLQIVAAAVFILVGYQFVVLAMREGEIAFVAPFRYTSLLWSILLGAIVFAEIPDLPTILGSVIVVATGLYTLYREHRVAQRR